MCRKSTRGDVVSGEDISSNTHYIVEAGVKFMIGQVCRYAPGFVLTKKLIEQGIIGELFYVESEYAHDYLRSPGVGGWRKDSAREPFISGGCYAVDLVRWIEGDVDEVFAYSNHKMLKD